MAPLWGTALFLTATALMTQLAQANPSSLACSRGFTVGSQNIMGSTIVEGGSTTVKLAKAGTVIACGGEITAGDSLAFEVSGASGQYLIEATAGTIAGNTCSGKRTSDKTMAFIVPDTGVVIVRVGWSTGRSVAVKVSQDCEYRVKAAAGGSTSTTSSGGDGSGAGTGGGGGTTAASPTASSSSTTTTTASVSVSTAAGPARGVLVAFFIALAVTMMTLSHTPTNIR